MVIGVDARKEMVISATTHTIKFASLTRWRLEAVACLAFKDTLAVKFLFKIRKRWITSFLHTLYMMHTAQVLDLRPIQFVVPVTDVVALPDQ